MDEQEFTNKKDAYLKILVKLEADKRELERMVANSRKEQAEIQDKIKSAKLSLGYSRKELKDMEDEVVSKVRELESDKAALKREEESISKRIAAYDKKEAELRKRELTFREHMAELKVREKEINQSRIAAARKLDKIGKVNALKLDITTLRKDVKALNAKKAAVSKRISELESKEKEMDAAISERLRDFDGEEQLKKQEILDHMKELQRKESALMSRVVDIEKAAEMEKTLSARQAMLDAKEKELEAVKLELEGERHDVDERKFQKYLSEELDKYKSGKIEVPPQRAVREEPEEYDVRILIKNAHAAVDRGELLAAKRLYTKIGVLYPKLPDDDEKRQIYYEILDLKNSIELAM